MALRVPSVRRAPKSRAQDVVFPEVFLRIAAALGLAVALAGCRSTPMDEDPGALVSRCGRYTLRVGTVEWRRYHETQAKPVLAVRASMEGLGPDVPFLHARTQWRTRPDERRSPLAGAVGTPEEPSGTFVLNFEPWEGPLLLKKVQLECLLLRVLAWTEHCFPGIGEGASGPHAAAPYSLGFQGEPGRFRSTSGVLAELTPSDLGVADARYLGPVWAGRNVKVTDAKGRVLARTLPKENWMADYAPGDGPVAYPVRVDLRIPERYFVETVVFDIEEIEVPPVPADLPVR